MSRTSPRPAQRGKRPHPIDWTAAEVSLMRDLYPRATRAEITAALPRRTWVGIGRYASKHHIVRACDLRTEWTEAEYEQVRQHYGKMHTAALAELLQRSWQAVKMCAARLGLSKPRAVAQQEREARDNAARVARLKKQQEQQRAKARQLKATAAPVVAAPKPKPAPKPVVVAPEPVKRSPSTPLLNARAEQRRLAEKKEEQKPKPYVTAAEIKALGANHPARWAWTRAAHAGPAAATEAFHAAMQQYKQAA